MVKAHLALTHPQGEAKIHGEHANARLPTRSGNACGYDIWPCQRQLVKPNERATIKTGIYMEMDGSCWGQLWARSGLAAEGIDIKAEPSTRTTEGEIKVIVHKDGGSDLSSPQTGL